MPAKKQDTKGTSKGPAKPKKEGAGGGKAKKKKWSKGKVRDKLNNAVLFDKGTYDKLYKDIPISKLITPSVVSERLKVRGSLARAALKELHAKGIYLQPDPELTFAVVMRMFLKFYDRHEGVEMKPFYTHNAGEIKLVSKHHSQIIYTRNTKKEDDGDA